MPDNQTLRDEAIAFPLSDGGYGMICKCHAHLLGKYLWSRLGGSYARNSNRGFLHKLVLGISKNVQGDHINHDTLDNRCSNLRVATRSQNGANRRRHSNNKSGYKGVFWDKDRSKWRVVIECNGKQYYPGRFDRIEDAARSYNRKAIELFGEFASLNIIPDGK